MYHKKVLSWLYAILGAIILTGCEKALDEVRPVSLGLPIKFGKFEPGDKLLAGQTLSIKGTGLKGLTEVLANGTPVQYTITDDGVDIKLEPFYFPDGIYKFQMKRFDGDQLVVTPPVQVYSFHLTANAGKVGDEVSVLAAGGLNNVKKILFTSTTGTIEAPISAHSDEEIKFNVPEKSVRGKLYLQIANPSDPANTVKLEAGMFGVLIPEPVITSVSPVSASYGSVITITGRNFGEVGQNGELFYSRRVLFTMADGSQAEGTLVDQPGAQTATQIKVVVPYFVENSLSVDIEWQASNTMTFMPNGNVTDTRLFYIANGVQLNALTLQSGVPPASAGIFSNVTVFAIDKAHNRLYYSPDDMSVNSVDMSTGQTNTVITEPNGIAGLAVQNNRIFWWDVQGTVHHANFDGSNQQIVYTNPNSIRGFCVSTDGNYIFVSYEYYDNDTGAFFARIDKIDLQTNAVSTPFGNTVPAGPIQFAKGRIYYSSSVSDPLNGETVFSLMSVSANGGSPETVLSLQPLHILGSFGIDADANRLYWTDVAGGRKDLLKSANLNGSNIQELGSLKETISSNILVW